MKKTTLKTLSDDQLFSKLFDSIFLLGANTGKQKKLITSTKNCKNEIFKRMKKTQKGKTKKC